MSHGSKNLGVPLPDSDLLPLWREVLDLAEAFRAAEPWRHMARETVLGVREPGSGEIDWCTTSTDEHEGHGLFVYRGAAGYANLRRWRDGQVEEFDDLIAHEATVLAFVDAAQLGEAGKAILKLLGRRYRGAKAWPQLVRCIPGYLPVPPDDAATLQRLAEVVRGLLNWLPALRTELRGGACATAGLAYVLEPPFGPADARLLPLPRPVPTPVVVPAHDRLQARRLRQRAKVTLGSWFVDWFCGLTIEDGPQAAGRPYLTAQLLLVELHRDLLLKLDFSHPEEVPRRLQAMVLDCAATLCLPAEIVVRRPALAQLLGDVAADLGCPVRLDPASVAVTRGIAEDLQDFLDS